MKLITKRPFTGILAFAVVFLTMPLGHVLMILMQAWLGEKYQFVGALLCGILGFICALLSIKYKSELVQTYLGLFAGTFLWTGFVEFSYVFYAQHLGIAHRYVNGDIVTKAEYLLMPSSIGLLIALNTYFFLDPKTRCNMFIFIRKMFGMKIKKSKDKHKNYALVTLMEYIFIVWSFYLLMLLAYDESIGAGDRSIFTYILFFGSFVWSVYLIWQLLQYKKMGIAIRYSIPTVIIFWNCIEILGRWDFFKEIWIHPLDYTTEIMMILIAFIVASLLIFFIPSSKKAEEERE